MQPVGIFGPLITEPPPRRREEDRAEKAIEPKPAAAIATTAITSTTADATAAAAAPAAAEELDPTRKRQIDTKQQALQNGSPAKKPRLLSNGHDATAAAGAEVAPPTPMDIDSNENQLAYPSPMEGEPAPTPAPRTDGPEQGTQVDKVEELATETTFLQLAPDQVADNTTIAESQQPGHENPIVLHCEWNPRNPSVLAAAGTDALARIWTISRAASISGPVTDHVNGRTKPYKDLIDEDGSQRSTVTAMAWNPDGTNIALATESGSKAHVSIWSPDGTLLLRYNVREPPVIKLRWNPNGTSILGIAPENGGTLVSVFSAVTSGTASYLLQSHDLNADPLDAAWTSESDFLLCGGALLAAFHLSENGIVKARVFETNKDDSFVQIQFDGRSRIAATASEKGVIDVSLVCALKFCDMNDRMVANMCFQLWNEAGERRSISAHLGLITSLAWQPLQPNAPDDERLLASGGEDGAISIWNARIPESKPKCSMTMELPVVALSFTPDGAFIAGATPERVLIWKVGEPALPRASWRRTPHPGWLSPKANGENEEEDTHCLCWDTTGQKLAYGVNNRVSCFFPISNSRWWQKH